MLLHCAKKLHGALSVNVHACVTPRLYSLCLGKEAVLLCHQQDAKPCQKVLEGNLISEFQKGANFSNIWLQGILSTSQLKHWWHSQEPQTVWADAPAQDSVPSLMYIYAQDPAKLVIQQASSLAFIPHRQMIQGSLGQAADRSGLDSYRGWPPHLPVSHYLIVSNHLHDLEISEA